MRAPILALLSIATSHAIPLKVGTTLGYKVRRGTDSSFTTLLVAGNSGTLWTVSVRDSSLTTGVVKSDSAVLNTSDGDTVWSKSTCLAPWDPATRKPGATTYGSLGVFCARYRSEDSLYLYSLDGEVRKYGVGYLRGETVVPRTLFARDTGMVRFQDDLLGTEWQLERLDGQGLPGGNWRTPGLELVVPITTGRTWSWIVEESVYLPGGIVTSIRETAWGDLKWTIEETLPDSLGWNRWTVQSVRRRSWLQKQASTGISWRSGIDSTITASLDLRIHPWSGKVMTSRCSRQDSGLAAGFVRTWWEMDSSADQGWTRLTGGGPTLNAVGFHWRRYRIKPGFGPDSLVVTAMNSGSPISTVPNLVFHAGSADTIPAPEGLGVGVVRRVSLGIGLHDLVRRIREKPGLSVLILDASGRKRLLRGESAVSWLQSRSGIVFVALEGGPLLKLALPAVRN
jgi:hypothetical protein